MKGSSDCVLVKFFEGPSCATTTKCLSESLHMYVRIHVYM